MKATDLLEIIGEADPEFVHDAKAARKGGGSRIIWVAVTAACLAVAVGIGWLVPNFLGWNFGPAANSPYNDHKALEYVGSDIGDMTVYGETVVMNEIQSEHMDAFRRFHTVNTGADTPYYDTRSTPYRILTEYPISGDSDVITFSVFRKNGEFNGSPSYDDYLSYLALDEKHGRFAESLYEITNRDWVGGYYLKEKEIVGFYTQPLTNCILTMIAGKELYGLDPRLDAMLPLLDNSTGTAIPSSLGGTQVVVSYFYQTRLYREKTAEEATEEAYLYYAYFEIDSTKYLCQFSSNWALPGQEVGAMHNPPQILDYASSQEACRTAFGQMLWKILMALQA